ncbi:MAG: phosphoserine phosphatase SerB [Alphaproteobacteria bacterium]|nr:phosphoserine phosphatase SerB [Alphaproteobacteria bacterium]
MTHILTLVSAPQGTLENAHLSRAIEIVQNYGLKCGDEITWLSPGKAAEFEINVSGETLGETEKAAQIRAAFAQEKFKIDLFITPQANRRKKLLLADMDSTIVAGETLDDMAAHAGLKEQIAEITARAMNGTLDFHAAIIERVGLLKDLPIAMLQKTLEETIVNPGAETLTRTMRKHGATCVLVSGGFTFFTEAIARLTGFDHHHGNTLGLKGGIKGGINGEQLSGEVIPPILDKFAKVEFLNHYLHILNLNPENALTIGDGANDIPMLHSAGLGIGYRPKPVVATAIQNLILHGDLTAALYAQGYSDSEFS